MLVKVRICMAELPAAVDFVALIPIVVVIVVVVVVLFRVGHQLEGADALTTQVQRTFA